MRRRSSQIARRGGNRESLIHPHGWQSRPADENRNSLGAALPSEGSLNWIWGIAGVWGGGCMFIWATLLFFCPVGSASGAERHIGPVVSLVAEGGRMFSASQGGVFEHKPGGATLVVTPVFRIFGMAAAAQDAAGARLILVGGMPGESGVVASLDLASKRVETRTVSKDVVYDVAVSLDGGKAAFACADNRVLTLDLATFAKGDLKQRHKHTADARAVAWSPDGSRLVSGGLDGVLLVSRSDGEGEIRVLQQHSAGVESVTFSPDGRRFASGSRDAKVRIHSAGGEYVRTYTGLGLEAMRSGLERKPYVVALAWGGKRVGLVAGVSTGGLYRLAEDNADWEKLEWRGGGPVFSLAIDGKAELRVGMDGKTASGAGE